MITKYYFDSNERRFWKCKITKEASTDKKTKKTVKSSYEWVEWDMLRKDNKSLIEIPGKGKWKKIPVFSRYNYVSTDSRGGMRVGLLSQVNR